MNIPAVGPYATTIDDSSLREGIDAVKRDLRDLGALRAKPTVALQSTGALNSIRTFQRLMGEVPTNLNVKVKVAASGQISVITNAAFLARHDIDATRKAAGGYISGRGTSTSDSIPAMLSNGEYVVNAAAVREHRALLDAINSGRLTPASSSPATNGVSGRPAASDGSAGGAGTTYYNNVTVTAVPGETAAQSVPRALREAAFLTGIA